MNPMYKKLAIAAKKPDGKVDLETFAELIIQECLQVADQFEDPVTGPEISDSIIEHFGLR